MSNDRPAGWYPDGTNYGQQRWWDGNQWTSQVQAPYQGGPAEVLRAPEGTSPYNVQIWLIVGIYILLALASAGWLMTFDASSYMSSTLSDPTGLSSYAYLFSPTYIALVVLGFLGWAGTIALAYFDGKVLESRGVPRPFHWAFTFIPSYGPTVYIIGRSVVARRRTGSGLAPMWVHIASLVGGFVLAVVATVVMMGSMMSGLPGY